MPSRILQTLVVNAPPHRKYAHVLASDILESYAGRSIHVSEIGKKLELASLDGEIW